MAETEREGMESLVGSGATVLVGIVYLQWT